MKFNRKLIILVSLGIISGLSYLVISQSYPVALVNNRIIEARDFERDYSAALKYYQSVFKVYNEDAAKLESQEVKQELRRATLDKLIENRLIRENLEDSIASADLQDMIDKKIEESVKESPDLQKGVELVYELSLVDFKKRILTPQAEREILEGRLFFDGKNIDDWLKQAKSEARVIVLISGFGWNGAKVVIK